LKDPYVVGEEIDFVYQVAATLKAAGFDAMTDYEGGYGGTTAGRDAVPSYRQATWSLIATYNSHFLGKMAFIPPVPNQIYPWPRADGTLLYHYRLPEPGDVTHRVRQVLSYIKNHAAACDAQTAFMYSWNEHSEGGGLCPTMGPSPGYEPVRKQLDEVAAALRCTGAKPIGHLDSVAGGVVSGWACDRDDPTASIAVHLYLGSPAGAGAKLHAVVQADRASEKAVSALCGGGDRHRFKLAIADWKARQGESVYAYGINIVCGQGNPLLSGAPQTL
jgi:hypothetical protein